MVKENGLDICARKHGGNQESVEAFSRGKASHSKSREDVLFAVSMAQDIGLTSKEYCAKHNKPLNAVSGRFTELRTRGYIEKTGERRDGCAVYVAV